MAFQEGTHRGGERTIVRFRDGDMLEGVGVDINLDAPDFRLQLIGRAGSTREVLIPFASVKTVLLRRDEVEAVEGTAELRRVAVRFWDGEEIQGFAGAGPERHQHGMVLPLVSPTLDEIEVFAIPYAAVKGVFFAPTPAEALGADSPATSGDGDRRLPPLLRVLGEIRVLSKMHVRGDIDSHEYERRRREALSLF